MKSPLSSPGHATAPGETGQPLPLLLKGSVIPSESLTIQLSQIIPTDCGSCPLWTLWGSEVTGRDAGVKHMHYGYYFCTTFHRTMQRHIRTFALHPNRLMLLRGPLTMPPEKLSTGDCVCVRERDSIWSSQDGSSSSFPTIVRKLISHNNQDTETWSIFIAFCIHY